MQIFLRITKGPIFYKNVSVNDIRNYQLKRAYEEKIPLSQKKYEVLTSMLDENIVPLNSVSEFKKMLHLQVL